MMVVPLPSLIVINSTTNHHYLPEDEPEKLTSQAIELFLEQIRNENAPVINHLIFFLNPASKYFSKINLFSTEIWWK